MADNKPIRLTITVTPEVHAAFERLSAASGTSMSRCMGEWLGDTIEAVEYTATLVEKARQAPKLVMREVHAYALGLADETGAVLQALRSGSPSTSIPSAYEKVKAGAGADAGASRARGRAGAGGPPPCNTGGKVPLRTKKTGHKTGGAAK
jgi:hypothetical protein